MLHRHLSEEDLHRVWLTTGMPLLRRHSRPESLTLCPWAGELAGMQSNLLFYQKRLSQKIIWSRLLSCAWWCLLSHYLTFENYGCHGKPGHDVNAPCFVDSYLAMEKLRSSPCFWGWLCRRVAQGISWHLISWASVNWVRIGFQELRALVPVYFCKSELNMSFCFLKELLSSSSHNFLIQLLSIHALPLSPFWSYLATWMCQFRTPGRSWAYTVSYSSLSLRCNLCQR